MSLRNGGVSQPGNRRTGRNIGAKMCNRELTGQARVTIGGVATGPAKRPPEPGVHSFAIARQRWTVAAKARATESVASADAESANS